MTGAVVRPEPATSADAQRCLLAYYDELAHVFPAGFDPSASTVVDFAELSPPDGQFLILDLDGRAVGCGAVRVPEPGIGEIKRMWIDESVRGQGYGTKLLDELEAWASRLGCTRVRLDTGASLHAAIALYRSRGYREIPPYNDNLYADLWFEKHLPIRRG